MTGDAGALFMYHDVRPKCSPPASRPSPDPAAEAVSPSAEPNATTQRTKSKVAGQPLAGCSLSPTGPSISSRTSSAPSRKTIDYLQACLPTALHAHAESEGWYFFSPCHLRLILATQAYR